MEPSETTFLVNRGHSEHSTNKLSVVFAIICIVDVFGVFPVVALPKAIIDCGFYGILVIFFVCSIQIYTANLLGKCWLIAETIDSTIERKARYPYTALAELTYGSRFSNFVSFIVDVTIFGAGIPNLIVASQNLQLLGLRLSGNSVDVPFCYWIIIMGMVLCPILWLGSPKDMKLICTISVSFVLMVFLLVTASLISADPIPLQSDSTLTRPFWELMFTAYGIISFQYDIHPSILTIHLDMKEKSKLTIAIIGGFLISLSTFGLVTTIAAIKFGSSTHPSILETLSTSVPLDFAAFFVALQLCLSSAISNNALYQHYEDCLQISTVFNHRRCILRTTVTIIAIVVAESVPRFDLVMSLIGGALTGPLVFIFPPMFYLKMLSLRKKRSVKIELTVEESYGTEIYTLKEAEYHDWWQVRDKIEVVLCIGIIISSVICTLVTTYINVKNTIVFVNFSKPCIYNVTKALVYL